MDNTSESPNAPLSDSPVAPPPDGYRAYASTQPPIDPWQTKYEKAKKRSLLLAVTTAGASVLAVVAVVWGVAQSPSTAATSASAGLTSGASGQLPRGGTGQLPGGGPGGMDPAADLFNADGSINTAAVEQFLTMMPPGLDASTLIDQMESDGAITAEQADALREAASSSGAASSTGTNATSGTAGDA